MSDKKLERCKKYLRSTLLSNKGGVPADEVYKAYQELVGEGIPYTQFNFPTLEAFLSSVPDVCQICWVGRDLMVVGVAGQATQHIEKMVARQQNSKKGGRAPRRVSPGFGGAGGGRINGVGASWGGGRPSSVYSEPRYRPPPPPLKKQVAQLPPPVKKFSAGAPTSPRKKIDLAPVQKERAYLETVGGPNVFSSRVQNLLQGRQRGLFNSQVEKMYQKKWEESLPRDWCTVLERQGKIRVEKEAGAISIVFSVEDYGGQSMTTSNMGPRFPSLSQPSIPTHSEWDITVCSVQSTNSIHLWLGGGAEQLKVLHTSMLPQHRIRKSVSPVEGGLYSAMVKDGQCRRVKVVSVNNANCSCRCLLLDYGEEEIVEWNKLIELDIKYRQLPVQAIKASLAGVQQSFDKKFVDHVVTFLMGRRLVGVLVGEGVETTPALVLFDTSQKEDIMVSEEIIKFMSSLSGQPGTGRISPNSQASKSLPNSQTHVLKSPTLPPVGEYYDLVVSHVVSPTQFYVQSYASMSTYQSLPTQMSLFYSSNISTISSTDLSPGNVLAVIMNSTWYRAMLIRSMSGSLFCLRLVDTGRMVMATRDKIRPLEKQFRQLPCQAVRAGLNGFMSEEWSEEAVEWFKHAVLGNSLVGLVNEKTDDNVVFTMYDTSMNDVDIVINKELVNLGLAKI